MSREYSRRQFLVFSGAVLASSLFPNVSKEHKENVPLTFSWKQAVLPEEFQGADNLQLFIDPNVPNHCLVTTTVRSEAGSSIRGYEFSDNAFGSPSSIKGPFDTFEGSNPHPFFDDGESMASFLLRNPNLGQSMAISNLTSSGETINAYPSGFPNVSEASPVSGSESNGVLTTGASYKVAEQHACILCAVGTGKKVDIVVARYNLETNEWEDQGIHGTNNTEEEETQLSLDGENAFYLDKDNTQGYSLRKASVPFSGGIHPSEYTIPGVSRFFVDQGKIIAEIEGQWILFDWNSDRPTKEEFSTDIAKVMGIQNLSRYQGSMGILLVGEKDNGEIVYTLGLGKLTDTKPLGLPIATLNINSNQSHGNSMGFISEGQDSRRYLVLGNPSSQNES